jgi:hypothetical protein
MDEDNLELDLSLVLNGLEKVREYTDAIRGMAAAVRSLRRAMADAAKAQSDFANVQSQVSEALGKAPIPNPSMRANSPSPSASGAPTTALGLNARLRQAEKEQAEAQKSGNAERIEDAGFKVRRAQESLEKARTPRSDPMTREMQALYSTRINLPGGAAPLLGKTLDAAIGPAATKGVLAGLAPLAARILPMAAVFTVAKDAVEGFYQATKQSAEITNRITAAQASAGGSTADIARLGLMGGSAEAARSFQERVTSDPQAMTAAGRVGVHNLRGPYGNLNYSEQYLRAIENTANIADDRLRQQLALTLGIEQEVARYALLSVETRKRLKAQAQATGAINDPRTQMQGAEFDAAQQQMMQSWENAKVAFGSLFSDDVTGVLNELADGANTLAKWLKSMRGNNRRYKTPLGALTGGLLGDPGYDAPTTATKQTPLMANTVALRGNTEAMNRLTTNIGGGQYARDAVPSALRGQQLHEAMVTRSLSLGALG